MKRRILIIIISFFPAVLLSSCHSGASENENSITTDPVSIEKGENAFASKCSSCHNFHLDGIGPDLSGVLSGNSTGWIKDFIKDPKKIIESGDSTAGKLLKRYKTLMPSFASLPDEEIDQIIAFLNTKKKQERKYVKEDTNDIKNPLPDTIKNSEIMIAVKLIAEIPHSAGSSPFTRITKLDYQPNTGSLFILDIRGKLYKLEGGQARLYMDMAALRPALVTQPGIASGFGSFAFHPEFAGNGIFYTTHAELPVRGKADFSYSDSIPVMLQWVLTEWKTNPGSFPFSGQGREIFRINMPTSIHGVQEIAFRPQAKPGDEDYGLLYIGIGDGGSAEIGSPLVSAHPEKIWGTIIRIDPLGKNSRNGQYGIPEHNPFSRGDTSRIAPEVYAYGFRNPHRISWTRSGQLLAVNIGEHNIEALNLIRSGHFYGWPIREGNFRERFFNDIGKIYPLPPNDSAYHVTYPVAEFDHDEGTAISGGFEYQGNSVPQLTGKYVFGDIGTGRLFFVNVKDLKPGHQATIKTWNISMNGQPVTLAQLCGNKRVEIRFGRGIRGELYILTKADGKLYKLVPSPDVNK